MDRAESTAARSAEPGGRLGKWAALVCGFCLVWLFILVLSPLFRRIPMVDTMASYIGETGIDASALFYTEVEEAAMAELGARGTIEYPPRGPRK